MTTIHYRSINKGEVAGYLEPGTIYANLDDAMKAASCLSILDADGATIHGTTHVECADTETGEAYIISTKATRSDGRCWTAPSAPYEPIYTITRHNR